MDSGPHILLSCSYPALKNLPGAKDHITEQVEQICGRLSQLGAVELKAGELSSIVTQIQKLQRTTDSDWGGRVFLTKLLMSLASVSRVVQQFELVGVSMASRTPSRRPSPISFQGESPSHRDLDSSFIMPSMTSLDFNDTSQHQQQQNVCIETDLDNIIQHVSPPKEVLG